MVSIIKYNSFVFLLIRREKQRMGGFTASDLLLTPTLHLHRHFTCADAQPTPTLNRRLTAGWQVSNRT